MQESGGGWFKQRGKCNIESKIAFPDPKLVNLDTTYGPSQSF